MNWCQYTPEQQTNLPSVPPILRRRGGRKRLGSLILGGFPKSHSKFKQSNLSFEEVVEPIDVVAHKKYKAKQSRTVTMPKDPLIFSHGKIQPFMEKTRFFSLKTQTNATHKQPTSPSPRFSDTPTIKEKLDGSLKKIYSNIKTKNYTEKVQNQMVREYIDLIYREYHIADPLQSRYCSRANRSFKKAYHLKQSYLLELNSLQGPDEVLQKDWRKGRQVSHSQNINQMREINQTFRYCFICESPILQGNIHFHEQKCKNFQSLYNLSICQLHNALLAKVLKIQQQTHLLLKQHFPNQNVKNLQNSIFKYMQVISQRNQFSKKYMQEEFNSTMQCFEKSYLRIYRQIRKLQWFSVMLKNFQQNIL